MTKRIGLWRSIVTAVLALAAVLPMVCAAAEPSQTVNQAQRDNGNVPFDETEADENVQIEAALFASGYFRTDIPMDGDTQACLRAACEEFDVQFEMALAVIHQETNFHNVHGDGGNSIGYMQIQPRWHRDRMARLGVTDLNEPYQNFRVGCSLLRDLLDQYDTAAALTAYNTGHPGTSVYASEVMAYLSDLLQ